MQASRHAHDSRSAVRLALSAGGLVLRRIPGIGHSAALVSEWDTAVLAFVWRDHSKLPVFGDNGYPVTGEIDRGGRFWCRRRPRAPAAALCVDAARYCEQEHGRDDKWNSMVHGLINDFTCAVAPGQSIGRPLESQHLHSVLAGTA